MVRDALFNSLNQSTVTFAAHLSVYIAPQSTITKSIIWDLTLIQLEESSRILFFFQA